MLDLKPDSRLHLWNQYTIATVYHEVTMDVKRLNKIILETYQPVTHTAEDTAYLMSNSKIRIAYDALADKYTALEALLIARMRSGFNKA